MNIIQKKILTESSMYSSLIRNIIKDVITIYKNNDEGEFYLPEDITDEDPEYHYKDISITIEFILESSEDVDTFIMNADYYKDDDVIVIKIIYNPEKKKKIIYDMVGELNEIVAHELRHVYQHISGLFHLEGDPDDETGYEHYSRPEEVDAQYYGFKRMEKITKKPFKQLVSNWFKKNKDIHHLTPEEEKEIIQMILNYKS